MPTAAAIGLNALCTDFLGARVTGVLRLVAATLFVVSLGACTAVTGGGRPAPVGTTLVYTPDACYIRNTAGELWQVQCDGAIRTPIACYVGSNPWGLHEVECPRGRLRTLAKRRTQIQEE